MCHSITMEAHFKQLRKKKKENLGLLMFFCYYYFAYISQISRPEVKILGPKVKISRKMSKLLDKHEIWI